METAPDFMQLKESQIRIGRTVQGVFAYEIVSPRREYGIEVARLIPWIPAGKFGFGLPISRDNSQSRQPSLIRSRGRRNKCTQSNCG